MTKKKTILMTDPGGRVPCPASLIPEAEWDESASPCPCPDAVNDCMIKEDVMIERRRVHVVVDVHHRGLDFTVSYDAYVSGFTNGGSGSSDLDLEPVSGTTEIEAHDGGLCNGHVWVAVEEAAFNQATADDIDWMGSENYARKVK